jgi:hypothetical protein
MHGAIPPLPSIHLWCDASLKEKHRDNFSFTSFIDSKGKCHYVDWYFGKSYLLTTHPLQTSMGYTFWSWKKVFTTFDYVSVL